MAVAACILIERHGKVLDVAVLTGKSTAIGMCPVRRQSERCGVVVKHSWRPSIGAVAGSAACTECAGVRVILYMTGGAVHGRALEDTVHMAAFAIHIRMFSVERERKLGMIDTRVRPAVWRVAGSAIGPELTVMVIILQVAGNTILRSSLEDAVDMTAFAIHVGMLAVEVEGKPGVVNRGGFPT